jgi:hypothetical protein
LLPKPDNAIKMAIKITIKKPHQTFAVADAVSNATCDPMCGRWPRCHHITIGLAIMRLEYVPVRVPTRKVKAKSLITPPPKKSKANVAKMTAPPVIIVRLRV